FGIAPHDARQSFHALTAIQALDHLWKRNFGVSTVDVIDLRAALHDLGCNVIFQARPTHDDGKVGIPPLERPRQRQAPYELLKDHGKADQAKPAPVYRIEAKVDELRRGLVTQTPYVFKRAPCSLADGVEQAAVSGKVFFILRAGLRAK